MKSTIFVGEAAAALGSLPNLPHGGIATVLYRSESSASSLIEGLGPGLRRILEAEVADESEVDDETAQRVVRNFEALADALRTPLPLTRDDILRWHATLMRDHATLPPSAIGSYRSQQNWIGGDAAGPRNAAFIPPAPEDVSALVDDLLAFCARTDVAPVVHAGVAHARFEVIHPFVDGNGRVGRLLLQPLLLRRIDSPSPVPVSKMWSREKDRYIEGLGAYQDGDIDTWLEFFSVSIVEAVGWMAGLAGRIVALVADFQSRINTRGNSVTAQVIADLPSRPLVDTQSVAERYGVTPQSAHAALMRLQEAGILQERFFSRRRSGRPRRTFYPPDLANLL